MATIDALKLCSDALLLLGEEAIADFEGASVPQQVAAARYGELRDLMLASHPWRFNRAFVELGRLTAAPLPAVGFDAAYQLPIPCYRIVVPYVDGTRIRDWAVGSGVIWLDATASQTVSLEYHGAADEALWTPDFRQAVVYRLAADFAMTIREDMKARDLYLRDSEAQLSKARHRNAGEQPQRAIPLGRFQQLRGA